MEPRIRLARRDEISVVVGVYNAMWRHSASPVTMKMAENFFTGVERNPNHGLYVAELEGRIVGVFVLLLDTDESRGVLENVAIHPDYQRRGIGKKIVAFSVKRCRDANCSTLYHASNERREEEHGFYEHLGFQRQGHNFVMKIDS